MNLIENFIIAAVAASFVRSPNLAAAKTLTGAGRWGSRALGLARRGFSPYSEDDCAEYDARCFAHPLAGGSR